MKQLVYAVFCGLVFSATASAQETLTCTNGSCLTSGYEIRDFNFDLYEVGICNNSNCNTNGFNIYRADGHNTNVFCAGSGCFKNGFQEVTADGNADLVRTRTCKSDDFGLSDCIRYGWVDEFLGFNARIENIVCEDFPPGCDYGFTVETVVDLSASLEAGLAETEALIDQKREEFRTYVRTYKQPNQLLNQEIVALQQSLIDQKAAIRNYEGPTVADAKHAECLTYGGCFLSGYILN